MFDDFCLKFHPEKKDVRFYFVVVRCFFQIHMSHHVSLLSPLQVFTFQESTIPTSSVQRTTSVRTMTSIMPTEATLSERRGAENGKTTRQFLMMQWMNSSINDYIQG